MSLQILVSMDKLDLEAIYKSCNVMGYFSNNAWLSINALVMYRHLIWFIKYSDMIIIWSILQWVFIIISVSEVLIHYNIIIINRSTAYFIYTSCPKLRIILLFLNTINVKLNNILKHVIFIHKNSINWYLPLNYLLDFE